MRSKHHGFTLIELLIAMTIFAVLSGLAYRAINYLIEAETIAQEGLESITELQRAIMIWERDVRQVLPRSYQDEFGTVQKAINILEYANNGGVVEMTTGGYQDWTGRSGHQIQRVRYSVVEEKLIREYWVRPDYMTATPKQSMTILHHVKSAVVTIPDNNSSTSDDDQPKNTLPASIALEIEHAEYGKITRLLPLYLP